MRLAFLEVGDYERETHKQNFLKEQRRRNGDDRQQEEVKTELQKTTSNISAEKIKIVE